MSSEPSSLRRLRLSMWSIPSSSAMTVRLGPRFPKTESTPLACRPLRRGPLFRPRALAMNCTGTETHVFSEAGRIPGSPSRPCWSYWLNACSSPLPPSLLTTFFCWCTPPRPWAVSGMKDSESVISASPLTSPLQNPILEISGPWPTAPVQSLARFYPHSQPRCVRSRQVCTASKRPRPAG
ncbi:hypothetical protein Salat_1715400 [Sesamum alatum]|uniref:Uncharacterized protein n=1 Tax=Sesamum alatum TaxID=300844 RepID=A0AAE1Y7P9_9LAMI|nr:hypothetical protein Salat_1715400 [Sesamum alatum]